MGSVCRESHTVQRVSGFDLHANVAVPAGDRTRLEHLCRYMLRPPVAQDALELTAEGKILLTMMRPWQDGTRAILFEPHELIEKLAALVPKPRINLLLYHGVLGPSARLRSAAVAAARASDVAQAFESVAAPPPPLTSLGPPAPPSRKRGEETVEPETAPGVRATASICRLDGLLRTLGLTLPGPSYCGGPSRSTCSPAPVAAGPASARDHRGAGSRAKDPFPPRHADRVLAGAARPVATVGDGAVRLPERLTVERDGREAEAGMLDHPNPGHTLLGPRRPPAAPGSPGPQGPAVTRIC